MIGKTANDTCFATKGMAKIFNTDGVEREFLDPTEVRSALDFNIIKKPTFDEEGRNIPGLYHLVREDNNLIIPSTGVGARYTPMNHYEVYDYVVNEIMPKVPSLTLEAVGTLHGCGTGLISAKMGDDFHIDGDDSPNEQRLMFVNPCNGAGSITIGFTNVRLFCQNQIPAATRQMKQDGFSVRHTKNASFYIGTALEVIAASIKSAQEIRSKSVTLSKISVNESFINRVMNRIYPFKADAEAGTRGYTRTENRRAEVMEQFTSGETAQTISKDSAWKLFNSFTYPIFNPKTERKSVDAAEIAYTGAVGLRGKKVVDIFNTVYSEAMRFAA